MSTAANDGLPPFAQPYLADFEQLARMLARIPGFILQPVEAPSPDLARVFADWLTRHGWNTRIHEIGAADALRDLSAELVRRIGPTGRDVVIVAQSGALDDPAAHASFAALNMARDPIARACPMPILWWGSSAFMRTTWSQAPDWWSVAATPLRIPLRSLHDLPSHLPPGVHAQALSANVDARQRAAVLGDVAATLAVDAHIVLDLAPFMDDALRMELDQYAADATRLTEDPTSRALAALVRAKLALMSQAFDASEAFAEEALRWAQLADDPSVMTGLHRVLADCSDLRGDSPGER